MNREEKLKLEQPERFNAITGECEDCPCYYKNTKDHVGCIPEITCYECRDRKIQEY